MERKLPTINIEGTEFAVNVAKQELAEVANPQNTISFLEMEDLGRHYKFEYDVSTRNIAGPFTTGIDVTIPQMVELDPIGMAAHHNLDVEDLHWKTDFEIIVNQSLIHLREKGALPVIDIAGHPFYVDLRMDSLRPKDDFSTMGIRFEDIGYFLLEDKGVYQIPYDPGTRTFVNLDVEKATVFPEHLIVVEIPYKSTLDPLGYARLLGVDSKDVLRAHPPTADMKAVVLPWEKTLIGEIIKENHEKERLAKALQNGKGKTVQNHKRPLRKGRRM